jgi:hypothetical protein
MEGSIDNLPKNLIKAEMKRKGIGAKELCELLKPFGENLTELSFNNKISRGGFNAVFFFKCMRALKVKRLELE